MGPFEMVAVIVFFGCLTTMFRVWMPSREASGAPRPDPAQEQRIAKLEQRVQALEAVVTDHGYDLKKQFRELEKN